MFVTKGKLCNYYEMAKLSSEKRKNSSFTKKKSLVGLAPGANPIKEKIRPKNPSFALISCNFNRGQGNLIWSNLM